MPPAKKPTSPSTRPPAAFKEPAALRRLNKSLDSAQEALADASARLPAGAEATRRWHCGKGRSFQARVDQPAGSALNGGEAQHRQGRLSNDVGWRPRSVGRDAAVGEQQAWIVGERVSPITSAQPS
jgi:hypothetical protein